MFALTCAGSSGHGVTGYEYVKVTCIAEGSDSAVAADLNL